MKSVNRSPHLIQGNTWQTRSKALPPQNAVITEKWIYKWKVHLHVLFNSTTTPV